MAEKRMTILGHLTDLRRVIIVTLSAWALASAVSFWLFAREALAWLLRPLNAPAVFLGPADGFLLTFQIALLAGAILASPVIVWQWLWFVIPALRRRERRMLWILSSAGAAAFAAGAAFAYLLLLPAMLSFFMGFATEQFRPQIVASRYVAFVLYLVAGCGAAFELPIVSAALSSMGLLSHKTLLKRWRIAILGCFALAALITPSPDAFTMIMVALPLVALYGLGILTAALAGRR